YKTARHELRQLVITAKRPGDADLVGAARTATAQGEAWQQRGGELPPSLPSRHGLDALYSGLVDRLEEVEKRPRVSELANLKLTELEELIRRMVQDRPTLAKLPELHNLRTAFTDAGLDDLIDALQALGSGEERAVKSLRYAFLKSVLDELALTDLT